MTNIKEVLKAYHVHPSEIIPITKRVHKVQTHNYIFALKRSRMRLNNMEKWRRAYQIGSENNLSSILPVYMTEQNQLFKQYEQDIYYLTPWKDSVSTDEPKHEMESFYHTLGQIHKQTKSEKQISSSMVEQMINQAKSDLSKQRQTLLGYIEKFEQKHFMSPFELRVCMQYRDLDQVFYYLDKWYDYYLEDISDDNRVYISLCHGNLRSSHMIYQHGHTFLINWEKNNFANPINDLARFYYNEFKYHDCSINYMTSAFPIYEKYNPLMQSERSLLAIYLLTPVPYIQLIERYYRNELALAQPFQVKKLEQSYRRLINGLNLQGYFYQMREQLKEKELESDD
ncbi:protein kinase family protein [Aquibacillus rhizosphaerae]|uniref:Spore coat protein YsxE n=1 Tax=Aquibacillus rhizosphaerae TaxID=3051431 RepID=A0ABT7L740_9BACI|nr:hypothetical protein [Aquibacillus sp. LR5S19]MDL4841688.1 hypothetical protein [Aquibacillus sp. LR5S19]